MIAALYVQTDGCYANLPGVDLWDEARDARLYPGPWPVVAHPPCTRWCRLAKFVEARHGHKVGDDGGTFAAALAAVQRWGGVLEHPAFSLAWAAHDLAPPGAYGWTRGLFGPGWVCEVSQAAYGHRAPKLTWLHYCGDAPPPPLDWARPAMREGPWVPCNEGCGEWWCEAHKRHAFECDCPPVEEWSSSPYATGRTAKGRRRGVVETQGKKERDATPPRFRDLLLSLARGSKAT